MYNYQTQATLLAGGDENSSSHLTTDFLETYLKACKKLGLTNKHYLDTHTNPFLQHLEQQRLSVKCDKVSTIEWNPVFIALRTNGDLNKIRFFCENKLGVPSGIIKPSKPGQTKKAPTMGGSHIHDVGVSTRLGRSLAECLAVNHNLTTIELNGISFSIDSLKYLSQGIAISRTIVVLSLSGSPIGDDGYLLLDNGLRENLSVLTLQLSDCNLADRTASRIARLIKHLNSVREALKWQHSLRNSNGNSRMVLGSFQEHNSKSTTSSLTQLDLSRNRITDKGACEIAEALVHDRYLTELDLNSNFIRMTGAQAFKNMLEFNRTLVRINLKHNKDIDMNVLSSISSAVAMNNDPSSIVASQMSPNKRVPNSDIFLGAHESKKKPKKQLFPAKTQYQPETNFSHFSPYSTMQYSQPAPMGNTYYSFPLSQPPPYGSYPMYNNVQPVYPPPQLSQSHFFSDQPPMNSLHPRSPPPKRRPPASPFDRNVREAPKIASSRQNLPFEEIFDQDEIMSCSGRIETSRTKAESIHNSVVYDDNSYAQIIDSLKTQLRLESKLRYQTESLNIQLTQENKELKQKLDNLCQLDPEVPTDMVPMMSPGSILANRTASDKKRKADSAARYPGVSPFPESLPPSQYQHYPPPIVYQNNGQLNSNQNSTVPRPLTAPNNFHPAFTQHELLQTKRQMEELMQRASNSQNTEDDEAYDREIEKMQQQIYHMEHVIHILEQQNNK